MIEIMLLASYLRTMYMTPKQNSKTEETAHAFNECVRQLTTTYTANIHLSKNRYT